jgi:hypothetical protein
MKAWSSDEDWYERRAEELERLLASEAPVRAAFELLKTTDKLFGEEYAAYGLYVLDNQLSTKMVQDEVGILSAWSTVPWPRMPIMQHQAKVECRALIVMAYAPKGYEDPLVITKSGSKFVNSSIDLIHRATSGGHTPEEWLRFINHFDAWLYTEAITREDDSKFDLCKLLKAHPTLVELCVKLFLNSPGVLPKSLPPVGVFGTAARTFMPCEDLVLHNNPRIPASLHPCIPAALHSSLYLYLQSCIHASMHPGIPASPTHLVRLPLCLRLPSTPVAAPGLPVLD